MSVTVVLADDQPLIRAGLRVLLAETDDLKLVGEAGDGLQAVELTESLRPDVVVMDLRMPRLDGIGATRLIAERHPATRVLVLTTFDDDEYLYGALQAGASGFLVKDVALDDMLAAIRVVAAGDALIAPSLTRRLVDDLIGRGPAPAEGERRAGRGRWAGAGAGRRPDPDPGDGPVQPAAASLRAVTEREKEVLTLVGSGLSNAEIATRLVISPATAKAHVARLLTKLDARDRVQLVILAYEFGLVAPGR
ncbi:response regulator transcription factor [Kineosporia rhizophila]|uniref:response regulator transcription factor n=1 Tax=Kineosporia rhizophila TaxID=84633 RepID=UPI001E31D6C9|nr:response regulator transcription factor [Kineosporia rhizophila]